MTKLYARVGPRFDPDQPSGVLVAGHDLSDTYGFTEEGYDTADYGRAPTVVEVETDVERWADCDDVRKAAEASGIQVWATLEQYLENWRGATVETYEERSFSWDAREANEFLFEPEVVRRLEEAGFQAFRDHVAVSNSEPLLTAFWKTGTFHVSDPVELVADDPAKPYHVRLASHAPRPESPSGP